MLEKSKHKMWFISWLAGWEIFLISVKKVFLTEVNESDPFPLAMGDCAHVAKKKNKKKKDEWRMDLEVSCSVTVAG